MAKAVFHSIRGEKSALISVKPNAFAMQSVFVYVPKVACPANAEKGTEFDIPDNYKVVDWRDTKTGDIRHSQSGEALKVLEW